MQNHGICFFKAFEPRAEISRYHRHLPHWRQAGVTYFITFRLSDALPETKIQQWKRERDHWLKARGLIHAAQVELLSETDRRAFHRFFTAKLERWLDESSGSCVLRNQCVSRIVANALHYFDGSRYALDEFVIMPNHVHVLCCPFDDWKLEELLHSWKRHSARLINRLTGKIGSIWLDEYFDHIVRNTTQLEKFRQYIRDNPLKARLPVGAFLIGCGSGVHIPCIADL